jgi:hypothetical protein
MSNGGAYRADNRITINNIAELNLIVDALQTSQAKVILAAIEMDRRGTPFSRMMHLKAKAQGALLDRLRVGWKAADAIPEEVQKMLASREDARFWTNIQSRIEELTLETHMGEEDLTATSVYGMPG